MRGILIAGLLFAALVCGCAWVSVSDAGLGVAVVSNEEVIDCTRVGNTKGRVPRKLWFVPRREADIQRELETLARNEGGALGGNVVTPMGRERAGEREYAVYTCGD